MKIQIKMPYSNIKEIYGILLTTIENNTLIQEDTNFVINSSLKNCLKILIKSHTKHTLQSSIIKREELLLDSKTSSIIWIHHDPENESTKDVYLFLFY
jgi:hypothetical protein